MWELDCEESWAPKNWCFWTVVLEKTLESPLDCKEIQPVHPKGDQSWVFIGRLMLKRNSSTLATSCKELTDWKSPWCWEGLGAGGEGDDRGWDGWMASPTQGTWVWVNSGSSWRTGRPGILWFMGLQSVGHDWVTELNWTTKEFTNYVWWYNDFLYVCICKAWRLLSSWILYGQSCLTQKVSWCKLWKALISTYINILC